MALKGSDRQTHPTPEVETGGPPGDGGIDILAWIYAIIDWVVSTFNSVLQWVTDTFNWLIGLLVSIFHFLLKFLKHIWEKYVQAAIVWLYNHAIKQDSWLQRHIRAVARRMAKIKKWYDDHILKQQLRLLQLIQTIRRFLGILRLFHVKWAIALDNHLADLQNRIEESIRIVRGVLNEIINTLAMVLDPTLLLKTNVLGASLLANVGAVKRIFGYGGNRIFSGDEVATIDKQHSLYFASTVQTHLQTLNTSGPTQDDLDRRKDARQALTDVTDTSLPF